VNDTPSRPHRPLLDLFPPTGARDRLPGPALPPRLPSSHAPLEPPDAPRLAPLAYEVFGDQRTMLARVVMTIALIGLTLVGAAAAAWVFRDDAARAFLQWQSVPPAPGGPIRALPVPLSPIPAPADGLPPGSNLPSRPHI
jgi:hypothetical protein